ncbi:hypothetical protein Y032_0121g985 [Ancylostoma ceylanicum]|uniref:Uncharacterized protein n=1 Tax=Ancylostoma ceylanicum TaxID=53326 RepID=A0A016TAI3_9BILA|nr:hypothetical protein Y032_0121g985 [Ancylostoma ceylanicum]
MSVSGGPSTPMKVAWLRLFFSLKGKVWAKFRLLDFHLSPRPRRHLRRKQSKKPWKSPTTNGSHRAVLSLRQALKFDIRAIHSVWTLRNEKPGWARFWPDLAFNGTHSSGYSIQRLLYDFYHPAISTPSITS